MKITFLCGCMWICWLAGIPGFAQHLSTPLFQQISSDASGITCRNRLPEGRYRNIIVYQYYYNGGGVGIGDLNGDELPDVVLSQNMEANKLYLNQGEFRFRDISKESGIVPTGRPGWTTGVALVDVNQDGKLDMYFNRSGNLQPDNRRNLLYINEGNNEDGTPVFREEAAAYGLDHPGYSVQAVFLDYDRDGDLDAFLVNHGLGFFQQDPNIDLTVRDLNSGDVLLQNQNGRFVDVTESAGITSTAAGYGLGVAVSDINRDGWPDLYVSNDFFEHDYLYLNQQDGTFREVVHTATRHISNYSMGNDAADINNDGWPDVMVVDMVAEDNRRLKANMSGMNPDDFWKLVDNGFHHQYMVNTLHLNRGNETFSEVGQLAGVSNTDWSWAPLLADFDNDGWKDLFVSNGLRKDARNTDFRNSFAELLAKLAEDPARQDLSIQEWRDALRTMPSERIPNYAFRNKGKLQFEKVSEDWGLATPGFSNGAAYGDLDNDGDLDLVVSNIDEAPFVYRNQAVEQGRGNYLRIRLVGTDQNRHAVGTEIRVRTGSQWQHYEAFTIRGYQSTVDPILHVGLGNAAQIDELEIRWPDGTLSTRKGIPANQLLEIDWATEKRTIPGAPPPISGYFVPVDTTETGLDFQHRENEFDDFKREVLLPHKMSTWGPALATADVNGDGREDLFAGGAIGQAGQLYIQEKSGRFTPAPVAFDAAYEDVAAAFFDLDGDDAPDLYIASGGNEYAAGDAGLEDRFYLNDGTGNFTRYEGLIPAAPVSSSCVRPGDFDGDGDMDLFIGGRQQPGQYPLAGASVLLENDEGILIDVTAKYMPDVARIGMVTDAVWTDPDQDGDLDLLVAGEWMALTLFENQGSDFTRKEMPVRCESNPALQQLNQTTGWWMSLTAADLDGDGDDDYIAGNLGLNYKYKASPEEPFEVYSEDFDGNGSRDIVLSYYQEGEVFPLRGRSCSAQQIPMIKEKFPSYNQFATATLQEVYGEWGLSQALHLQANTFASYVIWNKGETWEFQALPPLAQVSSLNDAIVQDWNGDGNKDILIAGNMYGSEVETTRNDAGAGLLLLGDGAGNWQEIDTWQSGFFVPGDVRNMAAIPGRKTSRVVIVNNNAAMEVFEYRLRP